MKLRRQELKKQGKIDTEVSKITEGDLVEAYGITRDQMIKAGEILGKNKNTEKLGNSSAWLTKEYSPESYQSVDTNE